MCFTPIIKQLTIVICRNWLSVNHPALSCKKQAPQHLEVGISEASHPTAAIERFTIKHRSWLCKGLVIIWLPDLSKILLKTCRGQKYEAEIDFVSDFYSKDVKKFNLLYKLSYHYWKPWWLNCMHLILKDIVRSVHDIFEVQKAVDKLDLQPIRNDLVG